MKKLKLKNLKLDQNDLLQRKELKAIFGGYDEPFGGADPGYCNGTWYNCASGGNTQMQYGVTCIQYVNGQMTNVLYDALGSIACQ